jgi:hypothetical protein
VAEFCPGCVSEKDVKSRAYPLYPLTQLFFHTNSKTWCSDVHVQRSSLLKASSKPRHVSQKSIRFTISPPSSLCQVLQKKVKPGTLHSQCASLLSLKNIIKHIMSPKKHPVHHLTSFLPLSSSPKIQHRHIVCLARASLCFQVKKGVIYVVLCPPKYQ